MNNLINNEKHYITLNNYLKAIYHEKVFKIALNGNFSCPNRDGKISKGGCIYCSSMGSGDFAGNINLSLKDQFYDGIEKLKKKWPSGSYIAYFQANTNTYGTLEELKKRYNQIITENGPIDKKIKILSIATRPDCLDDEIIDYLSELNKKVTIWIELGFQTMHEHTALIINRGYNNKCFEHAICKLHQKKLTTIVHIINGLPFETKQMMIDTVKYLNSLSINGIKIHMLHVLKDAPLGKIYEANPFPLLSLEEYVDIVCTQLRFLSTNIVIHRLTGDPDRTNLIAPIWTLKKFVVIDEIDKKMRKENIYQGDLCAKNC